MSSAVKHDQGKPKLHLIEPEFILGLGEVLTGGVEKYGLDNWKQGLDLNRLHSALLRHLMAVRMGEELDPESGLSHYYHIAANTMMLDYYRRLNK